MLLEQKTLKQLIKNKPNLDINKIKGILQLDPTLNIEIITDDTEIGKYGEWLLGKLYKKYNQLSEDNKNTIKSDLQFYDYQIRSKRIPRKYDNIYKIKSIDELHDVIISLQQGDNPLTQDPVTVAIGNHQFKTVSGNPFELLKRQYYGEIKEGGTTKWLVFNPKTKEESIVAGYNTSWCTARDDSENQWSTYIYEGNTAWIFLLSGKYKANNSDEYSELIDRKLDKICIIVEKGQCQTRDNRLFQLELLPEIGRFIEDKVKDNTIKLASYDIENYYEGINNILSGFRNKNNRLFKKIKLTKEEQMKYLKSGKKSKDCIYRLKISNVEIDEDIQLQWVSNGGMNIALLRYIGIYPSEKVQLQQVSQDGDQIQYINIPDPSEKVQLQQVSQLGDQIRFIYNPSENVQLQQVSQNSYQIQYIINPSEKVQLQQVLQDGHQIEYIINPNEKVQLQQIKQNSDQYNYIEDPTPKQTQLYKKLKGITESTGYISKLLDVK